MSIFRVDSIDGSAKHGKRYHKVNQTLLFKEGDTEKFVSMFYDGGKKVFVEVLVLVRIKTSQFEILSYPTV